MIFWNQRLRIMPEILSKIILWLRASILIVWILLPIETNMETAFVQSIDKTKFPPDLKTSKRSDDMDIECPSLVQNSVCPCYKFEDGLFLECPGTTAISLRTTLQMITSPIQSLSIYDFDRSVTSLSQDVFQQGVNIRHLQFSNSHLETLKDNSLKNIRSSLESLSIVNGKLTQIPTNALKTMQKIMVLDFESNEITRIDNESFKNLRLAKLNMKGNRLEKIPELAFHGIEETMSEIDLSENRLKWFPMSALQRLDHLRTLRLAMNQISKFYTDDKHLLQTPRLHSLTFLDLSSNQFNEITDDGFRSFQQLKTLSLYSNQIETVHKNAFRSLKELMSLDMSRNRIIYLDSIVFNTNKKLQTIDLSHNHIHSISGVFSNLPNLREIFLSENNILELPWDAFTNSTNIDVIYLESNAIRHIDPNVFNTLFNLEQLYLRSNYIPQLPVTLLDKTLHLTSLSLDDNEIQYLEIGMFRKLEYLREVRLHNNRIRRIPKGVFDPLPSLLELHLQKNAIEEIEPKSFATLINLQHINLQNNQLQFIGDVFPLNKSNTSFLLSIQLNDNQLNSIHSHTFRNQENIQIMWLSDNRLKKLEKALFKDVKHLERIYVANNHIENIEYDCFSQIKDLKFLDISGNHLKAIRRDLFQSIVELEELNLSNNLIDYIEGNSFKKLRKLKVLDLSSNPLVQIKDNTFQTDLLIITLNLRNCSLKKIEVNSFQGLANLNEINFEDNFLSPVDILKLDVPSLRTLKLSNNNFSHIGIDGSTSTIGMFDKLRSLQQLTLANCSLTTIPEQLFTKNTNLVKLDLSDNQLRQINRNIFNGLNVFKELRLNHNQLIDFPHIALYNISTLELLTLSNNQLSQIDFFKLTGIPNIRYLDLKENFIKSLNGFQAVNLTQLDYIDLSGNELLTLPGNFLQYSINLQKVDLSQNRFLQIPSSALSDITLPRLSWLNLTGNPINKIYTVKKERYPYLKELYICQTNLTILTSTDFDGFHNLQHLHLKQNRIVRISPGAFNQLSNLLTLDLSVNELELMPRERLQGLKLLRMLNISHNSLKDLEEFSSDLMQLQIFDLSFNQLNRISKSIFKNLIGLNELNLMGNRITYISSDAFKNLRKLSILDLRKNYFEAIPLSALDPMETNLKTLKLEENPLQCSCDSQQLWEWLRDHLKLSTVYNQQQYNQYLRCELPTELRGKIFSNLEPQQFCDAPLIVKLAIQDIQPYSVIVSWQSRQHSGVDGYEIIYHALDGPDEVHNKKLNGTANSTKLLKLSSSTRYLICVIGTGNWLKEKTLNALNHLNLNETQYFVNHQNNHDTENIILPEELQEILKDSSTSRCTDVRTLDATPSLITDENGLSSHGIIHSILTRRLGLIVGCCLGIIVFIVLISILSYIKLKKQRLENAKRQHQVPPEYITYRHFSIPNEELVNRNTLANAVPSGIGAHISATTTTSSNCSATQTLIPNHNHTHSSYMSGVVLDTSNLNAC